MRSIARYWLVLSLIALALGGTYWWTSCNVPDSSYNGRKLSSWIHDLPGAKATSRGIVYAPNNLQVGDESISSDASEAEAAVRHIGTNALPFLMAELHAPDTSLERFAAARDGIRLYWQRVILRNRAPMVGQFRNTMTSGERRRWNAALALRALGPAAKPSIPELVAMLNARGGDGCRNAAYALSGMGPAGTAPLVTLMTNTSRGIGMDWSKHCAIWAFGQTPEAGRTVVPQLLAALNDKKNGNIRQVAMWTLGELHTNEEVIVPALASLLDDTSFGARSMTEGALRKYGISDVTRPALKTYLTNPKPYIRMAATNAYLALYPEEAAQLGLK